MQIFSIEHSTVEPSQCHAALAYYASSDRAGAGCKDALTSPMSATAGSRMKLGMRRLVMDIAIGMGCGVRDGTEDGRAGWLTGNGASIDDADRRARRTTCRWTTLGASTTVGPGLGLDPHCIPRRTRPCLPRTVLGTTNSPTACIASLNYSSYFAF